jgi:predicted dinucleotide-binding enzyme
MQIGFVGIGQMGLPLITNLVKADFAVHAFDTNLAAMQTLVAQGARTAASLPELVAQTDVVITTRWRGLTPITIRLPASSHSTTWPSAAYTDLSALALRP